jgi:hypothetical protein
VEITGSFYLGTLKRFEASYGVLVYNLEALMYSNNFRKVLIPILALATATLLDQFIAATLQPAAPQRAICGANLMACPPRLQLPILADSRFPSVRQRPHRVSTFTSVLLPVRRAGACYS